MQAEKASTRWQRYATRRNVLPQLYPFKPTVVIFCKKTYNPQFEIKNKISIINGKDENVFFVAKNARFAAPFQVRIVSQL